MKLLAFDPAKNKRILCGEVIGNALFRWVKPEHFMRKFQAYGIQEVAFQEIILKGVENIILKEEGTGKNWKADTKTWNIHGKVMDFGHGKQRFLSMKYMRSHELQEEDLEKERLRQQTIRDAKKKL